MQTLERKNEVKEGIQKNAARSLAGSAFFMSLLVFAAVNLILLKSANYSHKHYPAEVQLQAREEEQRGIVSKHSWSWWLTKLYEEQKEAPDVVVFGSSLLGSAHASVDAQYLLKVFDCVTGRRMAYLETLLKDSLGHPVTVFSLGTPGEMISDAYMMSKALFERGKTPKLVIATIAPRDFIDNTLPYAAVTEHYRFFSRFTDPGIAETATYPEPFARLGAELERLPLKEYGKLHLNKYAEKPKNDLDGSEIQAIKPGDALVPANIVPARVDNSREYVNRFKNPLSQNYSNQMEFFSSWLKDLRNRGIKVMVLCMPTTPENRSLLPESFWKRFRKDVAERCKTNESDWLDLSESRIFQHDDYLDTVHLNIHGGRKLFPLIAGRVANFSPAAKALALPDN